MFQKIQLKYLYIFTLCIAMIQKLPWFVPPWYAKYFHCVLWIGIYLVLVGKKTCLSSDKISMKASYLVIYAFLFQFVISWVFGIIGWLSHIESTQMNMITRAISNTLQFSLILFSVIATAQIFKDDLLNYTFFAVVLNYAVFVVIALVQYGLSDFILSGLLRTNDITNYWPPEGWAGKTLEVHDTVFATGIFFLYALCSGSEFSNRKKYLILTICIMYLGFKRIQILALLVTMVLWFVLQRIHSRKGLCWFSTVLTVGALIAGIGFVWLIDSGVLDYLCSRFNINTMGRLSAYQATAPYFEALPTFLGRGMGASERIGEYLVASGKTKISGHSDIMYRYIDIGWWGLSVWIIHLFSFVAHRISNKVDITSSKMWLLITAYAFATYSTDNTAGYFAFQTVYMVVMFHVIYTHLQKNRNSL